MKSFNDDLNTLEVYAYAHDEYHKLSGQLLIDTANRLPNTLKRRYIDYLHRNGMSLNQPSFESLREFVEQEIKMSTSDYAQAFFKSEDKNKTREGVAGRGEFRVGQVAVGNSSSKQSDTASGRSSGVGSSAHPKREFKSGDKKPPVCFVCSRVDGGRHYLGDCKRFTQFSAKEKRQAVISAGRCLNCLSTEHLVRDCACRSKCRSCGPQFKIKHAIALHACYATETVGAANREVSDTAPQSVQENDNIEKTVDVRSVGLADVGTALLRTTAVKVINQNNSHSTLAYAQLDTASQATLISDALRGELGLEAVSDPSIKIRTLADQTATCLGRTDFSVESLDDGNRYGIEGALVVPYFSDEESTLPQAVDTIG